MEEHIKQGETLFHEGKIREAESYFVALLERFPEQTEILNNIGVINHVQGNAKEAEIYFIRAHAANPDYIDALLNLADLYREQNQWRDAALVTSQG